MTAPIERQLRDYFDLVDRMQGPADLPVPADEETVTDLRLVRAERADSADAVTLTSGPRRRRLRRGRWAAGAVAAAAVLILVLVVAAARSDDVEVPADQPSPTSPLATLAPPEPIGDLGLPGSTVGPGRYNTPVLGVPVTFTVRGDWLLPEVRAGAVTMQSPVGAPVDVATVRWLMMSRLGGWNTSDEAIDPAFAATGSIEPHDIDRWIDENDVVVTGRREAEVAGRRATVLDVRVDPAGQSAPLDFARDPDLHFNETCDRDTAPCIWYRSVPAVNAVRGPRPDPVLHQGQIRRMWLITIGRYEPLLIEAVAPEGDGAWIDEIESSTIASLEMGADAPTFGAD